MIVEVLKRKTYYIFAVISALFCFLYWFIDSESTIVFNLKDTYFVISKKDVFLFFFTFFGLVMLLYFLLDIFKVNYSKASVWFYLAAFSITTGALFYCDKLLDDYENTTKTTQDLISSPNYYSYVMICIMVLFFLKFFFLINIFVSLIRHFSIRHKNE